MSPATTDASWAGLVHLYKAAAYSGYLQRWPAAQERLLSPKDASALVETAVHEAGHVVVFIRFGISVRSASIVADGRVLGHVVRDEWRYPGVRDVRSDSYWMRGTIQGALAGDRAQRLLTADWCTATGGPGSDYERATTVLRELLGDAAVETALDHHVDSVDALLDDQKVRSQIAGVALALLARGTVNRWDLYAMVTGGTCGAISERGTECVKPMLHPRSPHCDADEREWAGLRLTKSHPYRRPVTRADRCAQTRREQVVAYVEDLPRAHNPSLSHRLTSAAWTAQSEFYGDWTRKSSQAVLERLLRWRARGDGQAVKAPHASELPPTTCICRAQDQTSWCELCGRGTVETTDVPGEVAYVVVSAGGTRSRHRTQIGTPHLVAIVGTSNAAATFLRLTRTHAESPMDDLHLVQRVPIGAAATFPPASTDVVPDLIREHWAGSTPGVHPPKCTTPELDFDGRWCHVCGFEQQDDAPRRAEQWLYLVVELHRLPETDDEDPLEITTVRSIWRTASTASNALACARFQEPENFQCLEVRRYPMPRWT